jgi:hypothetical protein
MIFLDSVDDKQADIVVESAFILNKQKAPENPGA